MKHTSPETACASRAHRVAASPWRLAVVLLCATGCLESGLVLCANGLACPVTERCDEIHRTCVLPEQLSVCVGIADGTDCTSGPVSGACFDSVCLPRGCGNTVVEPIEMCDDGNQIAGDGCSGDCRSTERCGNGFIDPGEPCDDGDLVSRDGCDSRCQIEASVWSDIIAIAPSSLDGRYGAYDVARERFVYTRWEGTWEWDGARWTFTPPPSISDIFVEAVFYDPDRQQVSMIGSDQLGAAHLYVWVDAAWRRVDRGDGPMLVGFPPRIAATYDAARHRVMMIDTAQSTTWMIDATGAWSQLANVPGALTESVAAFDPASSHVVLETIESVEWVYDGSDWTSALTDFGPNVSLAFSPDRGRLVLVDNTTWTMHERLGATWTLVVGDELPCHNRRAFEAVPLYHDHGKSALTALSRDATQDCSWIPWASAWNVRSLAVPFHPIGATYDATTRSFAVLHNANPEDPDSPTEAWLRSGDGWQRVDAATTPGGRQPSLAVYAPGRAATVLYGERASTQPVDALCAAPAARQGDTWSFDGSSWTQLGGLSTSVPPCSGAAAAYDPVRGRVLLNAHDELWSLGDQDHEWVRLGTTRSAASVFAMAWDARNASFAAVRLAGESVSELFELRDDEWAPLEIGPSITDAAVMVSDERAGTVILIDSTRGDAWERAGPDWIKLPPAPFRRFFASGTAYNPVDGSVFVVVRTNEGTLAATLTRTSATPLESCREGVDGDGDGLAGCNDPDCYWTCTGPVSRDIPVIPATERGASTP